MAEAGGRALVDVRHPHVEWHGAELEGDGDHDERRGQHEARGPGALPSRDDSAPRSSVPVMPYSTDMPYSSVPEAMAPSTKYFMAASAAMPESRSKATRAYSDSDSSSTPM